MPCNVQIAINSEGKTSWLEYSATRTGRAFLRSLWGVTVDVANDNMDKIIAVTHTDHAVSVEVREVNIVRNLVEFDIAGPRHANS